MNITNPSPAHSEIDIDEDIKQVTGGWRWPPARDYRSRVVGQVAHSAVSQHRLSIGAGRSSIEMQRLPLSHSSIVLRDPKFISRRCV